MPQIQSFVYKIKEETSQISPDRDSMTNYSGPHTAKDLTIWIKSRVKRLAGDKDSKEARKEMHKNKKKGKTRDAPVLTEV